MAEPRPIRFDAPLGRRIIDLHVWAVRQGLSGAAAEELFAGFCRGLADAGVPLWRGLVAMRTLHPQWGGYVYSWQREDDAIELQQFGRRDGPAWHQSPFAYLLRQASASTGAQDPWLHLRRHLTGPDAQLDFPVLEKFAAEGGSDYFAEIVRLVPRTTFHMAPVSPFPSRLIGRTDFATMTWHCSRHPCQLSRLQ